MLKGRIPRMTLDLTSPSCLAHWHILDMLQARRYLPWVLQEWIVAMKMSKIASYIVLELAFTVRW